MENKSLSKIDKYIKNNVKESVLEEYKNNSVIRGLIQLVPYGALVDNMITTSYNNILIDRSKTFYSELNSGDIILTPEIIDSEDFLHAYFSTYKASLYTRQRDKIRFFARLLRSGLIEQNIGNINEYEDYLKILDELSYREICILNILYDFEKNTPKLENENALQLSTKFWNSFLEKVSYDFKIGSEEVPGLINRLSRSGCYTEFTGGYLSYTGGQGQTTGLFHKLVELIKFKKKDLWDINNF